jgi:uncharacterized membrane protein YcgQ (UPF0703/DUF1980 family)
MKSRWTYLHLFYIFSLVILAICLIMSFFRPFQKVHEPDAIQKMQLLRSSDAWIIQLQLANHEPQDVSYRVQTTIGQNTYHGSVTIKKDGVYIYNQPIKIEPADTGKVLKVQVNIYTDAQTPVESMTYYLPGVQS